MLENMLKLFPYYNRINFNARLTLFLYLQMTYTRKHSVIALLTCHTLFPAADIYEKVAEELEMDGHLDCECIGGGRIRHDAQDKKIHVYGYSMVRESCCF